MIVRAAAADALVLVPRGEAGELAAGETGRYLGAALIWLRCQGRCKLRVCAVVGGRPVAGPVTARVRDVALRGEEARVAGLELDDLAAVRRLQAARSSAATMTWP